MKMKKRNIKRFVKQTKAMEERERGGQEEKRKEEFERKNEKRVSECITLIGVRSSPVAEEIPRTPKPAPVHAGKMAHDG